MKEMMTIFKELINKLKSKKKQLEALTTDNHTKEKEPSFEITITQENNFYKLTISDYITITDYIERMNIIDDYNLSDLICNNVLWNDYRQRINKGCCYVILMPDSLYNILINDDTIVVDERTRGEELIEEKLLTFNVANSTFHYCSMKHIKIGDALNINGSTVYTRYYSKSNCPLLEMSGDQALEEIKGLFTNLEMIEDIRSIIDLDSLKTDVLKDLDKDSFQKQLKS